jgi:hypothetical protein
MWYFWHIFYLIEGLVLNCGTISYSGCASRSPCTTSTLDPCHRKWLTGSAGWNLPSTSTTWTMDCSSFSGASRGKWVSDTHRNTTEIITAVIVGYGLDINSVALSPQSNYTDRAIATCRRNIAPTFMDRGVSRGQRGGSPRTLISVF